MTTKKILFPRGSEWRKWDLQIQPIKGEWLKTLKTKKKKSKKPQKTFCLKLIKKALVLLQSLIIILGLP